MTSTSSGTLGALDLVFEWKQERALIFALLGPLGAGKSRLIASAVEAATKMGWHTVTVDLRQARELLSEDEFYHWLVSVINQQGFGTWKAANPRLDFTRQLEVALGRCKVPVLLTLDHAEQLSDPCVRSLIANLREIQDKGSSRLAWSKLRCVISGCISVFELRRQHGSPSLQFKVHALPNPRADWVLSATREYLSRTLRTAADDAVEFLGDLTGGEDVFLDLFTRYLGPECSVRDIDKAVAHILLDAGHIRYFLLPAQLYQLEEEFRIVVDGLLEKRWVRVPDASEDISRYQLLGATCVDPMRPYEVRFRNGLVQEALARVRQLDGVSSELVLVTRLRDEVLEAGSVEVVISVLGRAWQHLTGIECKLQLCVRGSYSDSWFEIDLSGIRMGSPTNFTDPSWTSCFTLSGIETSIRRTNMSCTISSSWSSSGAVLSANVSPGGAFSPNLSSRIDVELWTRFLGPLRERILDTSLLAVGRYALDSKFTPPKKVFVSSTFLDLAEHRAQIMQQIQRRDLFFRGMEYFGATSQRPTAQFIVEQVRKADLYLGIYARRYGSIDTTAEISMTELEYDEAVRLNKPRLCYVIHKDATVRSGDVETDPDKLGKLNQFLAKVRKDVVYEFKDIADLARQVYVDLGDPSKVNPPFQGGGSR